MKKVVVVLNDAKLGFGHPMTQDAKNRIFEGKDLIVNNNEAGLLIVKDSTETLAVFNQDTWIVWKNMDEEKETKEPQFAKIKCSMCDGKGYRLDTTVDDESVRTVCLFCDGKGYSEKQLK